jgi:hypothetical protein
MSKELKKKSAASAPSQESSPGAPLIQRQPRIYKSTQDVDHDLFKLTVSEMIKNGGYNPDVPMLEKHEHTHWFHTVDSSGRAQTASTPTGGHHHNVKVIVGKDGVPTLEVSGPKRWVKRKVRGTRNKFKRVEEDAFIGTGEDAIHDTHSHNVQYCGSEKITLRSPNIEASLAMSALQQKREPSIEGVEAGNG